MIALIRRIAERGITILLIEHVLTVLLALSQRLMVLNQGRVLVLGDPESVVREPGSDPRLSRRPETLRMTELLRIEGLEAGYGRIRILHGVSIATTGNNNVGCSGRTATARPRCCAPSPA